MTETQQKQTNKKFKTLDLVYIGLSAALIAICSWISIPLTVPITLQTLGVCLVAGLFGAKKGTFSVVIYILLGAIGVPVFSGFKGGIGALAGSTGGYIIGFIFTAFIVGIVSDKTSKLWAIALAMLGGVLVCYTFGTAWFAIVYAKTNEPASLATILGWCVFPFLLPDAVKIILAALLTNRLKRYIK
ncbi:MAG: biotin transporter BioY [Eubacterium sp.]|nr:biotin transporter BioY [Eubacterium sp.]MBR4240852.1 biotin transporter BioY [Eubacterium sp.]MBR7061012.1 biotin transporter BioY [Eubacterium sp.]